MFKNNKPSFFDSEDNDEDFNDFKVEAERERKLALKAAKEAQAISLIMLDTHDGAVGALHVGPASLEDNLRMVQAHRHLADDIEEQAVESTGISKARLAELYKRIEESNHRHGRGPQSKVGYMKLNRKGRL